MTTKVPPINQSFSNAGKYSDVLLAAGVLLVVALMVLRLPTGMIDALVGINIAIGIGLLLIAIYIPAPVAFNTFPSILLITTLFRLSLSVATTRLILLEADAGNIIDAFGNFVAGGNLVVGIVVFIIITVVQFIVIAKGAERVAEVAARFTLDAMPGKQMSIDSDLRSGLISQQEAKNKRKLLEKESQLNGALDGAMKFVKGDAIAGIIIVLVNLVGGLTIGVLQHGMSAGEAMAIYSILTIGDGMVAQVPALLSTMAAGLVVTRTAGEGEDQHLGESISHQIMSQPRALLATGLISLLLAAVPGFPSVVFLVLAGVLITTSYFSSPALFAKVTGKRSVEPFDPLTNEPLLDNSQLQTMQPLVLELGDTAAHLTKVPHLRQQLLEIQNKASNKIGIIFPELHYRINTSLPTQSYRVLVFDVPVASGYTEQAAVLDSPQADKEITTGDKLLNSDWLLQLTEKILHRHAADFIGIQEVNNILEAASKEYGVLVKEVLRLVPIQTIAEVFRLLVNEGIPVRNLRDIFEALVEWGGKEKDPANLSEFVRIGLKRYITAQYVQADHKLPAMIVQPDIEEMIRKSITTSAAGTLLNLSADVSNTILNNLHHLVDNTKEKLQSPTLMIAAVDVRRHIKKIIEQRFPDIVVLSYQELMMPVNVIPLGNLSLKSTAIQ